MSALVIVCSVNTHGIMVWVVIGCTRNTNVSIPLPPRIPPTQSSETSQNRVRKSPRLLKHERYHGLGKDALVIRCSRIEHYDGVGMDALQGHRMQSSMNIIMV